MDVNKLRDLLALSPAQSAAADISDSKVVNAGAGSGKTRVLTARYLSLLAEGLMPEDIVAITFTKKAAREMRERINQSIPLLAAASQDPDEHKRCVRIKEQLVSAQISTIHSFYTQVLRQYPLEAGIEPGFRVLDELDGAMLLSKAVEELRRQCLAERCPQLGLLAQVLGAQAVEEDGSQFTQLQELFTGLRNQGKTLAQVGLSSLYDNLPCWEEVRDKFCAHGTAEPELALMLTVSGKEKPEYTQVRMQLSKLAEDLAGVSEPVQLVRLYPRICRAMAQKTSNTKLQKEYVLHGRKLLGQLLTQGLTPLLGNAILHLLVRLEEIYSRLKAAQEALDFSDLQFRMRDLLHAHPRIVQELAERHQCYLVDEFQDTDRLQKEIIYLLLAQKGRIPPRALFVVGDEKQSIYRFRGAQVQVFGEVRRDMLKDDPRREVSISVNYRTRKPLIDLVNSVFKQLMSKGNISYIPLEPSRGGQGHCAELVHCISGDGESKTEAEARSLAARIQAMVGAERLVEDKDCFRHVNYGDIAILLRSRSNLKAIEHQLRLAGIPYVVVGGIGFYQRQEVQDLLNLLKIINNLREEITLVAVLRSPLFGMDDDSITQLASARAGEGGILLDHGQALSSDRQRAMLDRASKIINHLREHRERLGIAGLLERALSLTGYRETMLVQFAGSQRLGNIDKLQRLAEGFENRGNYSLTDFVTWVGLADNSQAEAAVDAGDADVVSIMTVHASKGLEFPVVFLPLASSKIPTRQGTVLADEQGNLAFKHQWDCQIWSDVSSWDREQVVEEYKRILYVAMTRARDYLVMLTAPLDKPEDSLSWWLQSYLPGDMAPVQGGCLVPTADRGQELKLPPALEYNDDLLTHFPGLNSVGWGRRTFRYYNISQFMLWKYERDEFNRRYASRSLDAEPFDLRKQQFKDWAHEPGGPVFGNMLHQALELLDVQKDLDKLLDQLVAAYFPSMRRREQRKVHHAARELLSRYREEPFAADFQQSQREMPFYYRHGQALFTGVIDRIFVAPDRVAVVDYKSNIIPETGVKSLVEHYQPQLLFYSMAAERLYRRPTEAWLYLLRLPQGQQLVQVPADHAAVSDLQEELHRFTAYCTRGE